MAYQQSEKRHRSNGMAAAYKQIMAVAKASMAKIIIIKWAAAAKSGISAKTVASAVALAAKIKRIEIENRGENNGSNIGNQQHQRDMAA